VHGCARPPNVPYVVPPNYPPQFRLDLARRLKTAAVPLSLGTNLPIACCLNRADAGLSKRIGAAGLAV